MGVVTFFAIWIFYKLYYKTKVIPLHEIDLISGKAEIDADEEYWKQKQLARGPLTRWQKFVEAFI